MLIMVTLKIASDLAFYYTFAGFFTVLAGASPSGILLSLLVQSVSLGVSYVWKNRGKLRLVPLALLAVCFLFPRGLADWIVLLPPAVYVIYLAVKEQYEPEQWKQIEIFSLYWKLLVALAAIGLLGGCLNTIAEIVVPSALIMMAASVLLMRSLRHEPQVYCQKRYQLMNVTMVLAVGACAWALSSRVFLTGCVTVLQTVYSFVVEPVLELLLYCILLLVRGLAWLFSLLNLHLNLESSEETLELNGVGAEDVLEFMEYDGEAHTLVWKVCAVLGFILLAVVLVIFFRYLARRSGSSSPQRELGETRSYVEPEAKWDEPQGSSPVQRVRAQYRKFLKLCRSRGIERKKSDTSRDVCKMCRGIFDDSAQEELRDIYIKARYNGEATGEDVSRAKELYLQLKK